MCGQFLCAESCSDFSLGGQRNTRPLQSLNAVFKKTQCLTGLLWVSYVDKQGSRYLERESSVRRGGFYLGKVEGGLSCSHCYRLCLGGPGVQWLSREPCLLLSVRPLRKLFCRILGVFIILRLYLVSSIGNCFTSQELFRSLVQMCLSQG